MTSCYRTKVTKEFEDGVLVRQLNHRYLHIAAAGLLLGTVSVCEALKQICQKGDQWAISVVIQSLPLLQHKFWVGREALDALEHICQKGDEHQVSVVIPLLIITMLRQGLHSLFQFYVRKTMRNSASNLMIKMLMYFQMSEPALAKGNRIMVLKIKPWRRVLLQLNAVAETVWYTSCLQMGAPSGIQKSHRRC